MNESSHLLGSGGDTASKFADYGARTKIEHRPEMNTPRQLARVAEYLFIPIVDLIILFVLVEWQLVPIYVVWLVAASCAIMYIVFSFSWCVTVSPRKHILVMYFGTLAKVYTEPGLYFFPSLGRSLIYVSTAVQTLDLKRSTVLDKNGNPITVSAVVTWIVMDSLRAAFDVVSVHQYLDTQAIAVMKRACSMYPYESKTGKSLQSEGSEVSQLLVTMLQDKAQECGVSVLAFELTDLQYAPEIANAMLVRQQAEALVSARQTIVEGGVQIVSDAVSKLHDGGAHLHEHDQTKVVGMLLPIICGDAHGSQSQAATGGSKDSEAEERNRAINMHILATLQVIAANTAIRK